jgi:hypothetical protein
MSWILTRINSHAVEVFVDQLQALVVIDLVADGLNIWIQSFLAVRHSWSLNSQVSLELNNLVFGLEIALKYLTFDTRTVGLRVMTLD